jgi:hypothetical protein
MRYFTISMYLLVMFVLVAPSLAQAQSHASNSAIASQSATPTAADNKATRAATNPPKIADPDTVQPHSTNPLADAGLTSASLRALMMLFVLAVVQESALALLFNWRPFVITFDGRGVRSLISLATSLALVFGFKIDVIARLMADYTGAAQSLFVSQLLTAMVLAGGSSGVNNMLQALGIRKTTRATDVTPKPDPNQAWLAVAVIERANVAPSYPVWVEIQEDAGPWQVAGIITGISKPGLINDFLRDRGRLPVAGGLTVKPGSSYLVRVSGRKLDGTTYVSEPWGPAVFRDRAVVDLQFKA